MLSAGRSAAPEIFGDVRDLIFERWLDVESGRWSAPAASDDPTGGRRFHGYR